MFRAPRVALLLLFLGVVLGLAGRAAAQGVQPRVTIMQSGGGELAEDLKYLTLLAGKEGKEQWPMLEEYLQMFLGGITLEKPMRVDVIFGDDVVRYRSSFAVSKRKDFLDNLEAFGIDNRRLQADFYRLSGDAFEGFMRFANGYASIAEKKADIPEDLPDPTVALAPLLKKDYDLAVDLRNEAEGMEQRRKAIKDIRAELIASTKRKTGEDQEVFELRKQLLEVQLDEAEWFFAEAKQLTMGWLTDEPKKEGRLELELEALSGTGLEEAINLLGQKPSAFAQVQRRDDSILFARVHHPLGPQRQERIHSLLKLFRPKAKKTVDDATDQTADQKEQSKRVLDLCVDQFGAAVTDGNMDGFFDFWKNSGEARAVVGGFKVVDSDLTLQILELLPKTRTGQTTKLDVDKVGDIRIHALTAAKEDQKDFGIVFGEKAEVYVGTGPGVVWYAAGEKVLDDLKTAIKQAGDGKQGAAETVVEFRCQVGPCLELLDQLRRDKGERVDFRREVIKIFESGAGTIQMTLKRDKQRVVGETRYDEDILRFVGHMLAKFSAETLQ